MPEDAVTCPPEIVMLLDHAIESGLDLAQYDEGPGWSDLKSAYREPVASRYRVIENGITSMRVDLCWTVWVRTDDKTETCLEWRVGERRWVGFRFAKLQSKLRWTRFYEGPVLT